MDRYEWHVLVYVSPTLYVDAAECVSRPITFTTGRSDLTASVGKAYGQISFIRKRLEEKIAAEIINPPPVDFGAKIVIYHTDDPLYQLVVGNITDISSNADEITFSFVEESQFKSTKGTVYSWTGFKIGGINMLDFFDLLWEETVTDDYVPYRNVFISPSPVASATFHPEDGSTSNAISYIEQVGEGVPTFFMAYDSWGAGWEYFFRQISDIQVDDWFVIGEEQVVRDYDLQRQIGDVDNQISTKYFDPATNDYTATETRTNQTSVDRIGLRRKQLETYIDGDYVSLLNAWTLGYRSPYGYPIVEFTTDAALLMQSPTMTGFGYRALLYWLYPGAIIDTRSLNGVADGFDDYMFIEQVTHRFDRSKWEMDIVCSAAGYTARPQAWQEVATTVSWEEATLDPTGDLTWDDLLYRLLEVP